MWGTEWKLPHMILFIKRLYIFIVLHIVQKDKTWSTSLLHVHGPQQTEGPFYLHPLIVCCISLVLLLHYSTSHFLTPGIYTFLAQGAFRG